MADKKLDELLNVMEEVEDENPEVPLNLTISPDIKIKIYNPSDVPFGMLSNNAMVPMVIDGKVWNTVTNYVYSNLLINPIDRLILQKAPIRGQMKNVNVEEKIRKIIIEKEAREKRKLSKYDRSQISNMVLSDIGMQKMDIYQLLDYKMYEEYLQTTRTAIEEAYNAKIEQAVQNKSNFLEQALLSSGNRPIVYRSDNVILGSGQDDSGLNIVGNTLMQMRHNIFIRERARAKEGREERMNNLIFTAYIVYTYLDKELRARKDLQPYMGKNAQKIIEEYKRRNHGPHEELPNKENVIAMYYRDKNIPDLSEYVKIIDEEIRVPGSMIEYMQKISKKYIDEQKEKEHDDEIVRMYLKYIIRQKYPNLEKENEDKAIFQFFYTIPSQGNEAERVRIFSETRRRIIDFYNRGMLPESLIEDIKRSIQNKTRLIEDDRGASEDKQTTSSSSSPKTKVEKDLKMVLSQGEKREKNLLIKDLVKRTGKPINYYKDMTVDQLKAIQSAKKGTQKGTQNSDEEGEQVVEQVEEENLEEKQEFIKPNGDVIEIFADPEKTLPEFREFSPLFEKEFFVKGLSYPSVSIYMIVCLLRNTGRKINMKEKGVLSRGRSIKEARNLLIEDNSFMSPEKANHVYDSEIRKTIESLSTTFVIIALRKKFEDLNMRELLSLTGKAQLIWNDRNDIFLGTGTDENPGKNIGGIELMRQIRDNKELPPIPVIEINRFPNYKKLADLLMKDMFFSNWVKMRLQDMCSAVFMVKEYLGKRAGVDEDIGAQFISDILNNIFQMCNIFPTKITQKLLNVDPPDEFQNLVADCKGLTQEITDEHDARILSVRRQIQEEDDDFLGIKNEPKVVSEEVFRQNQRDELQAFMKEKRSKQEIEAFRLNQRKQLEDFVPVKSDEKDDFNKKQRDEFRAFINEINKPERSPEEIKQGMQELRDRQQLEIDKLDKKQGFDLQEVLEKHEKERNQKYQLLLQPEKSVEERNRLVSQFVEQQRNDYLQYHGKDVTVKTKEEKAMHEKIIKDLKTELLRLNSRRKENLKNRNLVFSSIAHIYWFSIVILIYSVLRQIPNPSIHSLRQAIVKSQIQNAETVTCGSISDSLQDPEDNCIASALANIMIGIEKFKKTYSGKQFGKEEIDLAVAIIIGKNIEKEIEPVEHVPDIEDDLVFEDDLALEEYSDESKPLSEMDDMEDGTASFGMAAPKSDLQIIKNILKQVKIIADRSYVSYAANKKENDEIKDLNQLASYFLGAINTVKESRMAKSVKQNRINFFATIL